MVQKRREKYKGCTIKVDREDGKKRYVSYDRKGNKIGSNKTRDGAERRIRKHNKKPEVKKENIQRNKRKKERLEARTPREVDNYNGIPIFYHENRDKYHCKVEGHGKYCDDLDEAHAFIDKQLYKQSATYQAKKAEKKKKQDEELARARVYGIGTDDEGNEIPPTEEHIEQREDYYAKQKLIQPSKPTLREEYEEERGVEPSDEQLALRDEARQEEAEAQGNYFMLYWFKLQAEFRKLRSMIAPRPEPEIGTSEMDEYESKRQMV